MREKHITKSELAKVTGMPYTTLDSMLKRDSETKKLTALYRISSYLGVGMDELVGVKKEETEPLNAEDRLTEEESKLLRLFRRLDRRGKDAVTAAAKQERRSMRLQETLPGASDDPDARRMPIYDAPAAAGAALPLETEEYTYGYFSGVPENASYGIRIMGDSMEPLIISGSIVWVKAQNTLEPGEIGIFVLNGESLCKRLEYRERNAYLVSENEKYAPIRINDDDDLHVAGRVLI